MQDQYEIFAQLHENLVMGLASYMLMPSLGYGSCSQPFGFFNR